MGGEGRSNRCVKMYVADLHYNIKLTLQIILKGKMFTNLSLGKGGSEVHYAIGLPMGEGCPYVFVV